MQNGVVPLHAFFLITKHTQTMHILQKIALLFVVGALLGVGPALAQDDAESDQMTSEALESLFPESLGEASLEEVETQEDLRARGIYTHPDVESSISLALGYGKVIEEGVMEISSMQMMGAAEMDDWQTEEWEMQGHTVHYMSGGGREVAISLIDQFLVFMMAEETAESSVYRTLFESYDLEALASWEAPGAFTAHSLGDDTCLSMACFADRVSACESGQMMGQLGRRVGGVYTVEEPINDEQCLLSFAFTNNPNPDFVDQKVLFPVQQGADVAENFQEDVMTPMQACMEDTEDASEHCGGPLLEVME